MSDYYYATKEKAAPYAERIMELIGEVYDDLTQKYTDFDFNYNFSGPSAVNMVTYDENDDLGFEYDLDIVLNKKYTADDTVKVFSDAFSKYKLSYSFTVHEYDDELDLFFDAGPYRKDVIFTCCLHFIVDDSKKCVERYRYIQYDEGYSCYIWVNSSNKFNHLSKEIKWLKAQKLWTELRNEFLYNRDNCTEYINSKDLFMETVHKLAVKKGMYKKPKTAETKNEPKSKKEVHQFEYVTRKEAMKVRKKLDELINLVHKDLKSSYTFNHRYVGSSSRNMITRDKKGNVGYDFDVDIIPNLVGKNLKAKKIRDSFRNSLDKYSSQFGFSYASDSTSVITIKAIDPNNSKIKYSCDFAIVRYDENNIKKFIRCNKDKTPHTYTWEYRGGGLDNVSEMYEWIKANDLKNDLMKLYLQRKNENYCETKHSRSIFAESVKIICDQNGYNKKRKR